ncbi:MAG TPA: CpsD/CapB family tyrosine-protein kinase [Planctomycetota bacterium]|nr:CpsD/CapB family tyrosine-protein kinase [Planctomycetota bacterium]
MNLQKTIRAPLRRWFAVVPCLILGPTAFLAVRKLMDEPLHIAAAEIAVDLPGTPLPGGSARRTTTLDRRRESGARARLDPFPGAVPGAVRVETSGPGAARVVARGPDPAVASASCLAAAAVLASNIRERIAGAAGVSREEAASISRQARRERDVAEEALHQFRGSGEERARIELSARRSREDLADAEEALEKIERAAARIAAGEAVRVSTSTRTERRETRGVTGSVVAAVATLSGILALLVACVVESLDTRFSSPEDVIALRWPLLAAVPGSSRGTPAVLWDTPSREFTQSLIHAASSLRTGALERDLRSVAVLSTLESEGKTTLAVNLAIALAEQGVRVLLIDGSLKEPRIGSLFGLAEQDGLADLLVEMASSEGEAGERANLIEEASLLASTARTRFPNLRLLPAGRVHGMSMRLLRRTELRALVLRLCRATDLVLWDTPALAGAREAAEIAASVDSSILVVRTQLAERHEVIWARDVLLDARASLLGIVLNSCSEDAARDWRDSGFREEGHAKAAERKDFVT